MPPGGKLISRLRHPDRKTTLARWSSPGMSPVLKGCLIAFGLLLVAGLIFVVLVITTLESWFG